MLWPSKLEKDWQLLLDDLEEASHGFFLIEYDRRFTRDALLRRLQADFDRQGWSLLKPTLTPGTSLVAQLEAALAEWPAKAALIRLDNATPDQVRALNLARERLYELSTVLIFLASQETHTLLLTSARDLTTWIAPPYSFALPQTGMPHLPEPVPKVPSNLVAQIEYYREGVQEALERDGRTKAFDLLPPLGDLYLGAAMHDAAYLVYQALAQHHETGADERQAVLFTRRGDIAQGWRILADLQVGRLASDDRVLLRRLLNEGLFSVQESPGDAVIADEMGRTQILPPELLLTLKALSESVALGEYDRTQLRELLAEYFDREELRTLCFDLGVDYDDLPGEGKVAKARELVRHMERHNSLSELVKTGKRLRPKISWDDALEKNQVSSHSPRKRNGEPFVADDAQSQRLQRTLASARRTLTILEEQAAGYTALTIPAHLVVELEEKRRQVAELETELRMR